MPHVLLARIVAEGRRAEHSGVFCTLDRGGRKAGMEEADCGDVVRLRLLRVHKERRRGYGEWLSLHLSIAQAPRICTNVACCALLAALASAAAIAAIACVLLGDPKWLESEVDYHGRSCAAQGLPYLYWPHPVMLEWPVCVAHCPNEEDSLHSRFGLQGSARMVMAKPQGLCPLVHVAPLLHLACSCLCSFVLRSFVIMLVLCIRMLPSLLWSLSLLLRCCVAAMFPTFMEAQSCICAAVCVQCDICSMSCDF